MKQNVRRLRRERGVIKSRPRQATLLSSLQDKSKPTTSTPPPSDEPSEMPEDSVLITETGEIVPVKPDYIELEEEGYLDLRSFVRKVMSAAVMFVYVLAIVAIMSS